MNAWQKPEEEYVIEIRSLRAEVERLQSASLPVTEHYEAIKRITSASNACLDTWREQALRLREALANLSESVEQQRKLWAEHAVGHCVSGYVLDSRDKAASLLAAFDEWRGKR